LSPCRSTKGQPVQLRFDSPDDGPAGKPLGRKGRAAGFQHGPGGFAVNARSGPDFQNK